jgi:hypothetical protein
MKQQWSRQQPCSVLGKSPIQISAKRPVFLPEVSVKLCTKEKESKYDLASSRWRINIKLLVKGRFCGLRNNLRNWTRYTNIPRALRTTKINIPQGLTINIKLNPPFLRISSSSSSSSTTTFHIRSSGLFPSELFWNYGSYRQSVGFLRWVNSLVARQLQDNTNTEETPTDIHASNGFEHMIPAFERTKIFHVLDCVATVIGFSLISFYTTQHLSN